MKEGKRRNGYYFYKDRQLPSVSTILKSAGNSEGLIQWACKQGGFGVIWGLSKIKNVEALHEKLSSPSCLEWAAEQARMGLSQEGERVKNFGTFVHSGIEARLNRVDFDLSDWTPEMKTALATFEKFYAEVGFDPTSVEVALYSPMYGYAGRADLIANISAEQAELIKPYLTKSSKEIVPGFVVCDFKTGSMYQKTQGVQLAAYAQACLETFGRVCNGGLLINIPRDEPETIKCHYFNEEELNQYFNKGFLSALETWKFFDAPKWFHAQENSHTTQAA